MGSVTKIIKILLICFSLLCVQSTLSVALGELTPEQVAKQEAKKKYMEHWNWYKAKVEALSDKIQHPTAEEERQIEAGKREWKQKSETMTEDDYQNAVDEFWNNSETYWRKLDPAIASDADVIATESKEYIFDQIHDYAENLSGQVKKKPATPKPTSEPEPEPTPVSEPTSTSTSTSAETPASEIPVTVTQTVTTNADGNITQEVTSGAAKPIVAPGVETPEIATAPEPAATTEPVKPEETAAGEEPEAAEEPEAQFSGVYKDRQMFPDEMAVYCKMNAEDVVNDMSKLESCIRKYVTAINNENAGEAREALKDFNLLRYDALNNLLLTAVKKTASINGYEKAMNQYAKAGAQGKTEFDSEASTSNTMAFSTNVMNGIRELYIEFLKYDAINGFGDVDPKAMGEEEKTEKAKKVEENKVATTSTTTNVETQVVAGEGNEEGEGGGTETPTATAATPTATTAAAATAAAPVTVVTTPAVPVAVSTTSQSVGDTKYADMSDRDLENAIEKIQDEIDALGTNLSDEDKGKKKAYKQKIREMEAELKKREEDKYNHPENMTDKELVETEAKMNGRIKEFAMNIARGITVDKDEQRRCHEILQKVQEERQKRRM